MLHRQRWTAQKIAQRLALIEPLVYRRRHPLPPFRHRDLAGPLEAPPVGPDIDDSGWPVIAPPTYWGTWFTDFVLRNHFQVPADWDPEVPVALYLPLGEAGDFSHPEALAYVDGTPYATCDRHHQEILLPAQWRDGGPHLLALHGWTGLGGWRMSEPAVYHPLAEATTVAEIEAYELLVNRSSPRPGSHPKSHTTASGR